MKLAKRPCSQCPFVGKLKLRKGRVRELLTQIQRNDSHFVCHKTLEANSDRIERDVTCRGYWDAMMGGKAHAGQMVRIAMRLKCVREVDVE